MDTERHLRTEPQKEYELVDSGEHAKLERFGNTLVSRPDTQAVWKAHAPERWSEANATFSWTGGKGAWTVSKDILEPWLVRFGAIVFNAKLTAFKHTGIFPEQEPNWTWTKECIQKHEKPKVLNLFGYTGGASIAGSLAGALVTHVDSSKTSTTWAKENATLSNLPDDAIRFIVEDVRSFVKREIRREAKYDGILLDPPAFGRGAKDEVWKIEEDLLPLLELLKELLSDKPDSFFLLNGYASGYAPLSFLQLVKGVFEPKSTEYGEMRIVESTTSRELPCGMYVRFIR
jgi:23S rRNA (cytosine1962-C5)-methyltransferase